MNSPYSGSPAAIFERWGSFRVGMMLAVIALGKDRFRATASAGCKNPASKLRRGIVVNSNVVARDAVG
jgi:hypothetical protein